MKNEKNRMIDQISKNLETAKAIWLAADVKAKKEMETATELKNKATELYTKAYRDMMDAGAVYEQACYSASMHKYYKESLVNYENE